MPFSSFSAYVLTSRKQLKHVAMSGYYFQWADSQPLCGCTRSVT